MGGVFCKIGLSFSSFLNLLFSQFCDLYIHERIFFIKWGLSSKNDCYKYIKKATLYPYIYIYIGYLINCDELFICLGINIGLIRSDIASKFSCFTFISFEIRFIYCYIFFSSIYKYFCL